MLQMVEGLLIVDCRLIEDVLPEFTETCDKSADPSPLSSEMNSTYSASTRL